MTEPTPDPATRPDRPTSSTRSARSAGLGSAIGVDDLAQVFTGFAEHRAGSYAPFTAALARRIAGEPALLGLAAHARPGQSRPDLVLACIHDLALEHAERGDPGPASAYARARRHVPHAAPGINVAEADPAEMAAAVTLVTGFALDQRSALAERVATRTVQTNEIGRVAYLYPALLAARAHARDRPLALIEIGASAGLNLLLDQYRLSYTHGDQQIDIPTEAASGTEAAAEAPTIRCALLGDTTPVLDPPLPTSPGLGTRTGVDLHPLDPADPADRRWLRALVWPEHTVRRTQLDRALHLAAQHPRPPIVTADATEALSGLLEGVSADEHPVVMHTAVLAHMTPQARHGFTAELLNASRHRALTWLAAEPRPDRDPRRLRLSRVQRGHVVDERALAAYHPHGATLTWAGDPDPARHTGTTVGAR